MPFPFRPNLSELGLSYKQEESRVDFVEYQTPFFDVDRLLARIPTYWRSKNTFREEKVRATIINNWQYEQFIKNNPDKNIFDDPQFSADKDYFEFLFQSNAPIYVWTGKPDSLTTPIQSMEQLLVALNQAIATPNKELLNTMGEMQLMVDEFAIFDHFEKRRIMHGLYLQGKKSVPHIGKYNEVEDYSMLAELEAYQNDDFTFIDYTEMIRFLAPENAKSLTALTQALSLTPKATLMIDARFVEALLKLPEEILANIHALKIVGNIKEGTPINFKHLSNLTKLTFCDCNELIDDESFDNYQGLEKIAELEFENCARLEEVDLHRFPKLTHFSAIDCINLKNLILEHELYSELKNLTIQGRTDNKLVFDNIARQFPLLQNLNIQPRNQRGYTIDLTSLKNLEKVNISDGRLNTKEVKLPQHLKQKQYIDDTNLPAPGDYQDLEIQVSEHSISEDLSEIFDHMNVENLVFKKGYQDVTDCENVRLPRNLISFEVRFIANFPECVFDFSDQYKLTRLAVDYNNSRLLECLPPNLRELQISLAVNKRSLLNVIELAHCKSLTHLYLDLRNADKISSLSVPDSIEVLDLGCYESGSIVVQIPETAKNLNTVILRGKKFQINQKLPQVETLVIMHDVSEVNLENYPNLKTLVIKSFSGKIKDIKLPKNLTSLNISYEPTSKIFSDDELNFSETQLANLSIRKSFSSKVRIDLPSSLRDLKITNNELEILYHPATLNLAQCPQLRTCVLEGQVNIVAVGDCYRNLVDFRANHVVRFPKKIFEGVQFPILKNCEFRTNRGDLNFNPINTPCLTSLDVKCDSLAIDDDETEHLSHLKLSVKTITRLPAHYKQLIGRDDIVRELGKFVGDHGSSTGDLNTGKPTSTTISREFIYPSSNDTAAYRLNAANIIAYSTSTDIDRKVTVKASYAYNGYQDRVRENIPPPADNIANPKEFVDESEDRYFCDIEATISSRDWYFLPSLSPYDKLIYLKDANQFEFCWSPARNQYGIRFKDSRKNETTVNLNYIAEKSKVPMLDCPWHHDFVANPDLPDEFRQFMQQLAFSDPKFAFLDRHLQPQQALEKIAAYCREFKVENIVIDSNQHWMLAMVQQKGACRHRAQAFALMCSYLGIPFRYVTNDLHAYAEAQIDGVWHKYDLGGADAPMNHSVNRDMLKMLKQEYLGEKPADYQPKASTADEGFEVLSQYVATPVKTVDEFQIRVNELISPVSNQFQKASVMHEFCELCFASTPILMRISGNYSNRCQGVVSELYRYYEQQQGQIAAQKFFYIDHPDDIKSNFIGSQVDADGITEINGPLRTMLDSGGVIVINWDNFSATEMATFKSLLDKNSTLLGVKSKKAQIIGLENSHKIKGSEAFYSRWHNTVDLPGKLLSHFSESTRWNDAAWQERVDADAPGDADMAEVELYGDDIGWRKLLVGEIAIDGNSFSFIPGALLNLSHASSHQLVLKNPPLYDPEFVKFMRELTLKKSFFANGSWHRLPSDFSFQISEGYHYQAYDATLVSPSTVYDDAVVVNAETFPFLFEHVYIDDAGDARRHPGFLPQAKHIIVSSELTDGQWAKLLHSLTDDKKLLIYPGIKQPGKSAVATTQIDVAEPKNIIIKSNDPAFTAKLICEQQGIDAASVYPINLRTDWGSLIEQTDLLSRQPLKFDKQFSAFWRDLQTPGKTIILQGEMNPALQQRLEALFTQQNQIIADGKVITPAARLVWITAQYPHPHREVKVNFADYSERLNYPAALKQNFERFCQIAQQLGVDINLNWQQINFTLNQLANENSILANEKIIKSQLLRNLPHQDSRYLMLNVIAKMMFYQAHEKATSELTSERRQKLMQSVEPWQIANSLTAEELHRLFSGADIQQWMTFTNDKAKLTDQAVAMLNAKRDEMLSQALAPTHFSVDKQRRRLDAFMADAKSRLLILEGEAGIGKTHTLHQLKQRFEPFWGEQAIIDWLTSPKPGLKILMLDEYNLEKDEFWAAFSQMENNTIFYKGQRYTIGDEHKVIVTGNPLYYPGRHLQTTMPAQGLTSFFKPLKTQELAQVIHGLAQGLSLSADVDQFLQEAYTEVYKELKLAKLPLPISIRDIENVMMRFALLQNQLVGESAATVALVACQHELSGLFKDKSQWEKFMQKLGDSWQVDRAVVQTCSDRLQLASATANVSDFILTPSRYFVWQLIRENLQMIETLKQDPQSGFGKMKKGISTEGPSGIGKSEIAVAVLKSMGYERYKEGKVYQPGDKYFHQITVGTEDAEKYLRRAFETEGVPIILDELNLDPELEKMLNNYLTGVDANGDKLKVQGGYAITSQNQTSLAGVKKNSNAVINRLHWSSLGEYPPAELVTICTQKLGDAAVAQRLVKVFLDIQANPDNKHVNTRNLFILLKNNKQEILDAASAAALKEGVTRLLEPLSRPEPPRA